MEAIMFLNIKNSVFFNIKLEDRLRKEFLNLNIVVEDYNLENSTYIDFIDYLEFQEYRKLYIVTTINSSRLHRFKNYIEEHCDMSIEIVILENLIDTDGDNNIYKTLNHYKKEIINDINKNEVHVFDGLYSLISGIYPDVYKEYIKHLFIDNQSLINKIDKSIIDNMLINGCIIVKEDENLLVDKFPQIFVNYSKFNEALKNSNSIDSDSLKEKVKTFFEDGIIEPINSNNIVDYMSELDKCYITRIFIHNDGIYCDVSRKKKLTEKLNTSYYDLKLRVSDISISFNKVNDQILKLFFVLNSLSNQLNNEKIFVTSPYNKGEFKEQYTYNKPFDLIGIQDGDRYLCYSLKNSKIYETERDFNIILEAYYKDELENLPKEAKEKVKDFKEIIENVN
ncbi:Uncharacterised protein [[Clostridium] sordellii]|uniref:hypothetical protein n=1 Tax=Paraclostridium sordellii TaxID=1505 RepID=UPI0005E1CE04|nr:hypothetical protein [Paeniclostridium sordellii]CEP43281.1 Uncharacterised protein [[Clostridium] sordellii] [Paeniclostridium sordellii]